MSVRETVPVGHPTLHHREQLVHRISAFVERVGA
jgi:hypothetical protein